MKILTAQQIREGDAYTILHEPIRSIGLMERAANQCAQWMKAFISPNLPIHLFCGTGNNGGDGLAISRMLLEIGYQTHTHILYHDDRLSEDCSANLNRLEHSFGSHLDALYAVADLPRLPADAVIVDALFGTGLNRPLKGLAADTVRWMNRQTNPIISIDLPSGMMVDASTGTHPVVEATHTLSFEFYKLAFLLPENAMYTGQLHVLPIDIHPDYIKNTTALYHLTDEAYIRSVYKSRDRFSHKGTYGHALLIAGSYGKTGASILAAQACVRSGVGLLTCYIPANNYTSLQTTIPEAMCQCDPHAEHWSEIPHSLDHYTTIGIGPGIGQHADTLQALEKVLETVRKPIVLDADALNMMGQEKRLLQKIPAHSLITPHPKEFERLFGPTENNFDRLQLQLKKSRELQIYIVLKGHFTSITSPEGDCYFNPTGNAGMATGGSGDVLTGVLTALLAQGYSSLETAVFGVYLHGLAGDLAAGYQSAEAMIASDIIAHLGEAFLKVSTK